jgi:hypothetical protein
VRDEPVDQVDSLRGGDVGSLAILIRVTGVPEPILIIGAGTIGPFNQRRGLSER